MSITIRHIEGFENMVTTETSQSVLVNYNYLTGGFTIPVLTTANARRTEKYHWSCSSNNQWLQKNLDDVYDRIFLGAAINWTLTNDTIVFQTTSTAGGINVAVYANANGSDLQLRRGTTALETMVGLIRPDWNYYVFEMYIHNTSGYMKVWINGSLEWTTSTYDTLTTTQSGVTGIRFNTQKWDDIYIATATGAGETPPAFDCYIDALFPNADTAQKDFSRSTGSDNYALVDEQSKDNDTTYVYSGTNSHKDLYDIQNIDGTASTVYAVKLDIHAKKDNTDIISLIPKIKSGATEGSGTTTALSTSYGFLETLFLTNPDTAASFTPSEINSLQIGQEVSV